SREFSRAGTDRHKLGKPIELSCRQSGGQARPGLTAEGTEPKRSPNPQRSAAAGPSAVCRRGKGGPARPLRAARVCPPGPGPYTRRGSLTGEGAGPGVAPDIPARPPRPPRLRQVAGGPPTADAWPAGRRDLRPARRAPADGRLGLASPPPGAAPLGRDLRL